MFDCNVKIMYMYKGFVNLSFKLKWLGKFRFVWKFKELVRGEWFI